MNLIESSIVWHNSETNETQTWSIKDDRIVRRSTALGDNGKPLFVGLPWSIVGVGGIDGEGRSDIVWHNGDTNETKIWSMTGARVVRQESVFDEKGKPAFVGLPWRIVGTGDIDGNGSSGVVWHNGESGETQIWLLNSDRVIMRRETVVGGDGKAVLVGAPWQIVGVNDLDGDGKTDILWHNSQTNETQSWLMDRHKIRQRLTVRDKDGKAALVGNPWSIAGLGDLDGNGQSDIVWHNSETNETKVWFMKADRIVRQQSVLAEDSKAIFVGAPWRIVGSNSGNAFLLLMRERLHQHYLSSGGRNGPLGYPVSDVQFSGITASRRYRGGDARATKDADGPLGVVTQAFATRSANIHFLGFRCLRESDNDQSTTRDEPYFVISVDDGKGIPLTKTFGPFENTGVGTESGDGGSLANGIAPNPLSIRVVAYENDRGNPKTTAENLQAEFVKLAQQAQSIAAASGADAADGPGLGPAGAAGGLAGIVAGPLGALVAVGVVTLLDLGDDFIGQDATFVFSRPENALTPDKLGDFRGMPFNARADVDGGKEGHYELFFDISVVENDPKSV